VLSARCRRCLDRPHRLRASGRAGRLADLSGHQVYACGSPAMIDAAKRDFMAQGLPEEEFFADAFSFASN
jgi:NAD(P)H-flavin reductase